MRTANAGTCELCGSSMPKARMTRHLEICAQTHDKRGRARRLVCIRLEALGAPEYWIYVEACEEAALRQVDALLRRVWLECCGHMSVFRVGRAEPAMNSKVGAAFATGRRFEYDYDFGTTTTLTGTVLGGRAGSPGRDAVRLLARNNPLPWHCAACKALATVVCAFCIGDEDSLFCDAHAGKHPCAADEAFLPVVNSPRMGMCGYTG